MAMVIGKINDYEVKSPLFLEPIAVVSFIFLAFRYDCGTFVEKRT